MVCQSRHAEISGSGLGASDSFYAEKHAGNCQSVQLSAKSADHDGSLAGETVAGKDGEIEFQVDGNAWSAKEQELTIRFSDVDCFVLHSITLFA